MATPEGRGSALFDMLAELARDPRKFEEFKKDPRSWMQRNYGELTEQQIEHVASGVEGKRADFFTAIEEETIRSFSRAEVGDAQRLIRIELCWC